MKNFLISSTFKFELYRAVEISTTLISPKMGVSVTAGNLSCLFRTAAGSVADSTRL